MNHRPHSLPYAVKSAWTALWLIYFTITPPAHVMAAGTWTALNNGPPVGVNNCMLLSDGTVLGMNAAGQCVKLTPNINGSYINGTWTTLATMNYSRLFFASQMLTNGNIFVAGGEYGTGNTNAEIYSPLSNTWTMAPNTPGGIDNFLDAISEILPNGNVLVAPVGPSTYGGTLIWNAASSTWTAGPQLYRGDDQDEASWVLLADSSILTIDPYGQNSERYIPSLNQWVNDGNVPVVMYGYGGELGAGFLLPNGNAFFIGGTNNTAIYTPTGTTSPGTWTAGPVIPNNLAAVDAPAAMMSDGNILCCLGPDGGYDGPSSFYEYNYLSKTFTLVSAPGGGSTYNGSAPFGTSMLDLPDGTVLFVGGQNSGSLYIYAPTGTPLAAGQPAINSITQNLNGSYLLTGTNLNGLSQGAAYGDDEQMNSNYPLVRMTNSVTGDVYYARTYDWSSTGVMTGAKVVTTEFSLPANLPAGIYSLVVVANGNSSPAVSLTNTPPAAPTGLTGTAGNAQATLSWNAVSGATAYNLKGLTTLGTPYYATVATVTGTNATNAGLVNAYTYSYVVTAVSAGGESSNSAALMLTPYGQPPVPAGVTAASYPFARIYLAWNASYGAASYIINRSAASNGPFTNLASSVNPFYTDSGLVDGATYYYEIAALSAEGESGFSSVVSATAQPVVDFGFEVPNIGSGNYVYTPAGAFWNFSGTNTGYGSGLIANGSAFGNPNAPEGVQAAFIQSNGVISQVLSGFSPGTTYEIIYAAAQRSTVAHGGQTWNVMIDNTVIQSNSAGSSSYTDYTATFVATAVTHTLSFVGTDLAGGDNTVFLDDVQVTMVPPVISNFSFELPSLGAGNYQYNPSGGSWTFNGASPSGSGIVANGSGFSNPNAPLGVQAAFVQEHGQFSQTITGLKPGTNYSLAYSAAQRSGANGGQSWNVLIGGTVIQSNSPGGTSYADYSANFVAAAASETLTFAGTDLAGGDNTVFIDNVSIASSLQPVSPLVTLTAPLNNVSYLSSPPINLAASVATNGNIINNVQFYDNASNLIGQAANPPYSYGWANPNTGSYTVFARVTYNGGSVADSSAAAVTVINTNVNFGFETPAIGSGDFEYDPSGTSWTFSGTSPSGSGLVANGSGFSNPNAPQGVQAAFVQSYGSIAQTLYGFTPGTTYTVTFSAAQRPGGNQHGGQSWNVMINNNVIGSYNPGAGATSYVNYTATFVATAANQTLAFVGTDLATGDNTVFIDNIIISPAISPIPPPILEAIAPGVNAQTLSISGTGLSDYTYFLSAATNLNPPVMWAQVQTNVSDVAGNITFTNIEPTNAQQFFRISTP
jgi:hypothetical protein